MARYHFCLVDDYDVFRKLLTAELDNYEEVKERAELLACLVSNADLDLYDSGEETRKIIVLDDVGNDVFVLHFSDVIRNTPDS